MSIKIALFASGSGSNAENIIKYFQDRKIASVELVLSNKATAYVIERAKKFDVPYVVFSKEELNDTNFILPILRKHKIDFVVLAGFLLKVPSYLIAAFPNRIINIHPALLPKYGGKGMYGDRVHQAVVAAGETESGISIHYVNENYDEGNIIFQAKCKVEPSDGANDVAEKVHSLEYAHFPQVIEQVISKLIV